MPCVSNCQRFWVGGLLFLVSLSLGCQSFRSSAKLSPFQHLHRCEQIVVHSDLPLDRQQRLVEELCAQRTALASKLRLAETEVPIHLYLYASQEEYHEFLAKHYPNFPPRRAIFVATNVELSVYAYWGDHLIEDLRHEVTHGYLHASLPRLPLWLDEGLAEYFEVGVTRQGLNPTHLEYLNSLENFQPNLAALEQLASGGEMTHHHYAEAWAWVHFLLESDVDKSHLLTDHLADLQQGLQTPLSSKIKQRLAQPELALKEHLESLRQATH